MANLFRVVATAATALAAGSPRRFAMAAPTTVVRSSTATTASSGRRRANSSTFRAALSGFAKSRVIRPSGNSASNVLGRSEATTRSSPSLPAAATKSSVRYVVVGISRSRRGMGRASPSAGPRPQAVAGVRRDPREDSALGGRVVGIRARPVVGDVEDLGDLRDLLEDHPLDPGLERDVGGAAALAAAAHPEVDGAVLHVQQLDVAAVPGHRGVDGGVE